LSLLRAVGKTVAGWLSRCSSPTPRTCSRGTNRFLVDEDRDVLVGVTITGGSAEVTHR
jgi:hypothetical protein